MTEQQTTAAQLTRAARKFLAAKTKIDHPTLSKEANDKASKVYYDLLQKLWILLGANAPFAVVLPNGGIIVSIESNDHPGDFEIGVILPNFVRHFENDCHFCQGSTLVLTQEDGSHVKAGETLINQNPRWDACPRCGIPASLPASPE